MHRRDGPDIRVETAAAALTYAERATDHQVAVARDEYDRVAQLMRLGIAMMAGMIAVLGVVVNTGTRLDPYAVVILAAGFLFAATAIAGLAIATVAGGGESGVRQGLTATRVQELVAQDLPLPGLMMARLDALADAQYHNHTLLGDLVRARAMALVWSGFGLVAHLMFIAYIGRGALHA